MGSLLLGVIGLTAIFGLTYGQGKSVGVPTDDKCTILNGIHVSMLRRIFGAGFHKTILSEFELMLTSTILPERCYIIVEETVPRGAFVDVDELKDLYHKTGLRTHVPAMVSTEKAEFESDAFRVMIHRNLDVQENLRISKIMLPIKMRYHRPAPSTHSGDNPSAIVKIQNPRILLNCQGEDLTDNCTSRTSTGYCSNFESKCQYINLPYKVNVGSLEVGVPVGNSDHTSLVVAVTTLVTCGATIYLLITLYRHEPCANQS